MSSTPEILGLRDRILVFKRAMTVKDVAELLNVGGDAIYRMANSGNIPSFRVGTSIRFDPKLLADWYARQ